MSNCARCNAELNDVDLQQGSCPSCGAPVSVDTPLNDQDSDQTVILDSEGVSISDSGDDGGKTLPLDDDSLESGGRTVPLDGDEFVGSGDGTLPLDAAAGADADRTISMDDDAPVASDDGADKTLIIDEPEDEPNDATVPEVVGDIGGSDSDDDASSAQTFISDEFDSDQIPASAGQDDTTSSETIISGEFDSDDSARSDHTVISDAWSADDIDAPADVMKTLQSEWGGVDESEQAGATIKPRDEGVLTSQMTLVIKSRVFTEAKHRHGEESDAEYELIKVLGQGGMGVVYSARQTSIDRAVALKMLKAGTAENEKHQQKFLAEAVVTGELDHPNIVPIYDVGRNNEGNLFYSMKHVQGDPWLDSIDRKTVLENVEILMRVCDAMAFAHDRGVIHRDLKPENIMIGKFGEVLVMDWGLAQPIAKFRKTRSVGNIRSMGGTPAYMAPEMALGPIDNIDVRSDVYLLGAILYEIVTGKPPHRAKSAQQCLVAAAQNKIAPTDKTGELVEIALKAMETNRNDRYQQVKDFQQGIRDYLAHTESIALAAGADEELNAARESGDYERYSRALFGFEEAFKLWNGNERAEAGLSETRIAYAESALAKGDYDLGLSLLSQDNQQHTDLRHRLEAAQRDRVARQQRLKTMRRVAAGMVAAFVVSVSYGYYRVNEEKKEANHQRDLAVEARRMEEEAKIAAVEAQKEEAKQREAAEDARNLALAAQKEEERQRMAAEAARQQEEKAKLAAVAAQKEEEKAKLAAVAAQKEEEKAKLAAVAAQEQERKAKEEAVDARNTAVAAQKAEAEQRKLAVEARDQAEYEAYVALIGLASAKIDENSFDAARQLLDQCRPVPGKPDLRNWEWGRLMHLCSQRSRVHAVDRKAEAVAIAPDDKRFVAVGLRGLAQIREVDSDRVVAQLDHQGSDLHAVDWSADGRLIATGGGSSSRGDVRIWDAVSGQLVRRLAVAGDIGHSAEVLSVAFSGDGQRLATSSIDETARIWDVASGEQLLVLRGHFGPVWSVAFSHDARNIVTTSQDGTAAVWTDPSGVWTADSEITEGNSYRGHRGAVYSGVFSPDGQYVITAGYDRSVRVWRPGDVVPDDFEKLIAGEETAKTPSLVLTGHTASVRSVRVADSTEDDSGPNRSMLVVSAGHDNTIQAWRVTTGIGEPAGESLAAFRGHSSWARSCEIAHDGSWLLSASHDMTVTQWSRADYAPIREFRGRSLDGHYDAVLAAAFSPDGRQVITASQDHTARMWEFGSGMATRRFDEGHEFLVSSAVVLPRKSGRRWLVTAAGDNTARIWNIDNGGEIHRLDATGRSAAIAVSSDGGLILTGGDNRTAKLWDSETGALVRVIEGHRREVTAVAFSPDGKTVFTGESMGRGHLWELATGRELHRLDGHTRRIMAAQFIDEGRRLVTASADNSVSQWDVAAGRELTDRTLAHPDAVVAMAISPDESRIVTSCVDRILRTWSIDGPVELAGSRSIDGGSASIVANIERHMNGRDWSTEDLAAESGIPRNRVAELLSGRVSVSQAERQRLAEVFGRQSASMQHSLANAIAFSPDGRRLLTVNSDDGAVQIWDASSGAALLRKSGLGSVWSALFDSDGHSVVSVGGQAAHMWNAETGADATSFHPHRIVASASFSGDRKRIVTAGFDNTARVWNAATGRSELRLVGHESSVNSATFSPDEKGSLVLTAGDDGTARLWDAADGRQVSVFKGHTKPVHQAVFSADGKLILTASQDGTARVWAVQTETAVIDAALQTFRVDGASMLCAAFSKDASRIVTGSDDAFARVWDVDTESLVMSCEGHTGNVTSVAFLPDDTATRVLTGSDDYTVKLWDVGGRDESASAREILSLSGHTREVTSVTFSPDGQHALTASRDGRAILWLTTSWTEGKQEVAASR